MNYDPLSRDAAPPRYQVESGSEDEDSERHAQQPQHAELISVDLDGQAGAPSSMQGRELVVFAEGAGKAWLESRGAPAESGRISYGIDQQASLHVPKEGSGQVEAFLMPSSELPQTAFAELASSALDVLAPRTVVVVDSYSPAAFGYHRQRDEEDRGEQVRFLRTSNFDAARLSSGWTPLEAPDAVIGVAAAVLAAATLRGIPALLLQVPDRGAQSHAQLYGSGHGGMRHVESAQLEETSLRAIDSLVQRSQGRLSTTAASAAGASVVDFVRKRRPALPRGSLGDGGMYM